MTTVGIVAVGSIDIDRVVLSPRRRRRSAVRDGLPRRAIEDDLEGLVLSRDRLARSPVDVVSIASDDDSVGRRIGFLE